MAKEILIADSDRSDQEKFKKIFETTDYRLVFSEKAEDTLLRVKLFKPDLIIAGASPGKMSSLELCKAIKTDPEFKHIPFILLSNIFDDFSEKDQKRVKADGIISKPFREDTVLNLVDQLMEEEALKAEQEFSLDGLEDMGEGEEEIIELVDVVEEPEQRMSIHDFVAPVKEEPFGEITPLESWEKLEEEEKLFGKEFKLPPEGKEMEAEGMLLQLEEEVASKEPSQEEELFGKIELEEILEKVERMQPSIEKEWPSEKEVSVLKEEPSISEEEGEKYVGLEEFKAALQKDVTAEPRGEPLQPFFAQEPKVEVPTGLSPTEIPLEKELQELLEEEFPEELLEEIEEEEIRVIEEPKEERIEMFEEVEALKIQEEEIKVVEEPKEEKIEIFERVEAPVISKEEIEVIEEPKEEKIEMFERVEAPKIPEVEISPLLMRVEQQMGEVIAKGVQEMMENFITKIIPEMTQNIITLTMDRIERMVKEIVPDLVEKAIQEEIKRLQKGEKD
jgi:CheY-like chemotaxis protein